MEQQMQTVSNSRFNFSRIFEYCLLALIALVPIAFLPSITISLYSSKIGLIAALVVVFIGSLLAFALSRGVIHFPKSKLLIPIALFPVIAFISSFFSGQAMKSMVGEAFELGTAGSLFILTLLLFLALFVVREETSIGIRAIYAFLISSGVIVLHLILRLFGASIMPASVASRIPNFLVGGSVDTAIILGAAVIASLVVLNVLPLGKKTRVAVYALLGFSMIFIGAVGFKAILITVGLFSLIYFVYSFSWSVSSSSSGMVSENKASFPSLVVLALSVLFILSGASLSGYLSNTLKINSIEVRPNTEVTVNLIGQAWKKNAVLGAGPNMFKELWDLHKPIDINQTQFWSSSFNFGSGFVPTVAATTGVLGLLSLLTFLALYLRYGFKAIFSSASDLNWRYVSLTSFLISLFLWVMAFVYVPSVSIVSLMFIFTGLFIATLVPQGVVGGFKVNIFSNPKASFASVFGIVVFLIASIAGGYFVWEKIITASIYQDGVALLSVGNSQDAKTTVARAISLSQNDLYWRTYAEASLTRAGVLLSSVSSLENLNDTQRGAIQTEIANAIESAKQATAWNSKNYENWFVLGRVYEVLASNGVEGALDNAKSAYAEAQIRAPLNPAIPLALARLSAFSGDLAGARENAKKSIEMKTNYTDAYYTLAQIEAAANNIGGAIQSVEAAAYLDPQNAGLYFQLGLLKYNNMDYRGAAAAFEQSISIVPNYANARYFLGLSYERLGRRADAVTQFEEIAKTNPDNEEINFILGNLKAGKSPFKDAKPPVTSTPEKRVEPPVKEE